MSGPSATSIIAALADDLPVGIWVARAPAGEFVYANRMFATLMGTGGIAEAAVGGYAAPYGIFTRTGEPYPEHRMPFVRALDERRVVVADDLSIHRPDRSRIDVRAFARPITDEAGEITHVVIAFFDITREVELDRERIASQQREQRTQRLEVADDGPGIPLTERDRVFEPYFTTKTRGPDRGTGLGLATVLGIVEAHQGSIEIAPGLEDRGATLRVFLPASSASRVTAPPVLATPRAKGHGTILVVDDDQIVRKALKSAIAKLGYEVLEAAGGEQALSLYRLHGAEISAVVLDMIMPGLSGRDTYLALRALAPDVRVLLMSGYTMNEEVQAILELGVRSFLSKPYSLEALARELELLTQVALIAQP